MAKWLAAGGIALLVVLLLMWKQVSSSSAEPADEPAATPTKIAHAPAPTPMKRDVLAEDTPPPATEAPVEDGKPKKLDKGGDEFFYAFIEQVPKKLSKDAAECYAGKLGTRHRNQKLVLQFKVEVRNGDVTIHNVRTDVDTIQDAALTSCFIQKVSRGGWHDDSLPDYDWDDELVIRPERGLKKYVKENVEYVGDIAPPVVELPKKP